MFFKRGHLVTFAHQIEEQYHARRKQRHTGAGDQLRIQVRLRHRHRIRRRAEGTERGHRTLHLRQEA